MSSAFRKVLPAFVFVSCAAFAGEPRSTAEPADGADMRTWIERYEADLGSLRRYGVPGSQRGRERLRAFTQESLDALRALDFDALDREGKVDWILMRFELEQDLVRSARSEKRALEIEPLLPFRARIVALAEDRRLEPHDPARAAEELDALAREVEERRKAIEEQTGESDEAEGAPPVEKALANRAAKALAELREVLEGWYSERKGYDPAFDWWAAKPHEALAAELERYEKLVREKLVGRKPDDDKADDMIVGDPIGRDALLEELHGALIPYTPEELIAIAEREFAWCETRMKDAAGRMGFADDWKQALEKVKQDHVAPGEQPALIRELAQEATAYVEENELVSVPALAKETWRMEMLSPEAQRESPFFLGGEVIQVSFPTDAMTHEEKRMSMRGNNVHFARATVHHEVIPGHHLQGFMNDRWFAYRWPFATPFWTEGWALWWEMLLWDRGFARGPEDEVGMLFWRMHRCARIRFSLGFHLGNLTPEQCIDMLVDEVGHERENAEAEVRRSFEGDYGPLYQIAYMIGALQFRALHTELVDSGKRSERDFHDAILQGGNIPVELVRARLSDLPLTRDFEPSWRFYEL